MESAKRDFTKMLSKVRPFSSFMLVPHWTCQLNIYNFIHKLMFTQISCLTQRKNSVSFNPLFFFY